MTGEYAYVKDVTLRKLVNYLCVNQILPVASSNAGYWLCNHEDFDDQIKSLEERAGAILSRAAGLREMKAGNYRDGNELFSKEEL